MKWIAAGLLGLAGLEAGAVVAPGVRDEAVTSRRLGGTLQASSMLDSSTAFAGSPERAWSYWTPRFGSGATSLPNALRAVPGGAQPSWSGAPWPAAPQMNFGPSPWFPGGLFPGLPPLSMHSLVAAPSPVFYQHSYNFLVASVSQASAFSWPLGGGLTQTFVQVTTLTWLYDPASPGVVLPPTTPAIPEADAIAMLLAGLGVFGLAVRGRRRSEILV